MIEHITSTRYHPKTNGLAAREVKTFKERIRSSIENMSQELRLQRFLLSYRTTVKHSTGRTPSVMFFGRHLRTYFDQIKRVFVQI